MKKPLLILLLLISALNSYSQDYNPNRYQSSIYPTITGTDDVLYGSASVWTIPYGNQDLFLNVYVPDLDNNQKRPLIIFAHAGGFINGSKDVDNMVAICDSFAKKGFVTATIDYRKGFNPLSGGSSERAVYRGIQDGKTSIRYFKTNASTYNIDTNYVFFGGMSAGGFIATHVAALDKESERPNSTYGSFGVNDLGCVDCGSHTTVSSSVRGVLDFWGAVQDTSIIEGNVPPMLLMHGENDPTVPFVYGNPFGVPTLPETYGSQPIKERLDIIGGTYEYVTSTGPLHMLDGSDNGTWDPSPNSFWSDTLLPRSTSFIYNLIKPNTSYISPQNVEFCSANSSIVLKVSKDHANSHFIWDYDFSNITAVGNTNSSNIELEFSSPGNYTIKVVEFNEILCSGDTLEFNINVLGSPYASFDHLTTQNEVIFSNTSTDGNIFNWNFGDGNTSTEQNPIHTYSENGEYTVTLTTTSTNGCSKESTQNITIDFLGINELVQNLTIISPFNETLMLNSSDNIGQIEIYSLDGKLIYTDNIVDKSISIDASNWHSGIYILMQVNQGVINQRSKIVKL
jgi:acetyl esterase/lipase